MPSIDQARILIMATDGFEEHELFGPRAILKALHAGEQEEIRQRARMMASVDEGIGAILETLERQGTLDNTFIVFLGDNGYDAVGAADGREALDYLRGDEPVDVILLDIMMPYFSGLEVLAEARQLSHRAATPVIILTAKGQEADRRQAMELGATDFFTKPFSPKKLLARVDELFE